MTYAAGNVKRGCMSAKSSAPELMTSGSSPYMDYRYFAIGVSVLIRIEVIIWAREKRKMMR